MVAPPSLDASGARRLPPDASPCLLGPVDEPKRISKRPHDVTAQNDRDGLTPDSLEKAVLPIFALAGDGRMHEIGSCFVVVILNPKLAFAFTAAHCLRHIKSSLGKDRQVSHATTPPEFRLPESPGFALSGKEEVFVAVPSPQPGFGFAATVGSATMVRAWWTEATDIGLLQIELSEADTATFSAALRIDTSPVRIGQPVLALGQKLRAESETDYEKSVAVATMQFRLQRRPGKVAEVKPNGDHIFNWPGFLLDCPLDSGMSGGPIIGGASDGTIVARGVISGDLSDANQTAHGSGGFAFASSIGPALLIEPDFEIRDKGGAILVPSGSPLIEWVRQQVLPDLGGGRP